MIHSVIGLIEKRNYKNVLMHEHIGCISNDLVNSFGKEWVDKDKLIDFAANILSEVA